MREVLKSPTEVTRNYCNTAAGSGLIPPHRGARGVKSPTEKTLIICSNAAGSGQFSPFGGMPEGKGVGVKTRPGKILTEMSDHGGESTNQKKKGGNM